MFATKGKFPIIPRHVVALTCAWLARLCAVGFQSFSVYPQSL